MEKIKVGEIINTHGIRGELKVRPSGNETFDRDIIYYINSRPYKITNSKFHKNAFLIKLKGLDNINDVIALKGSKIEIDIENLEVLEEDEFYVKDLIGIKVYFEEKEIGKIKDVLEYEVNDIYIVETENGEIMIPAVKEFILNVDIENERIDVKIIEGM